jgi:phospholipid transport system substrate-binding protein
MKKLAVLICFFIFFAVPFCACAADGPMEQTRDSVNKVLSILKNKDLKKAGASKERRQLIRKEVSARFDFEEMAKRAMGMYWQQRNAAEKKEFVSLFTDLLEKTYIGKIEGYQDEKVIFDDQSLDGDYAVVKTRIVTSKGVEIPFVYKLIKKDTQWVVYDVVVEEVSLISNYRKQFYQVIRDKSYAELLRRMKEKSISDKTGSGA